jgi:hypothetical protein
VDLDLRALEGLIGAVASAHVGGEPASLTGLRRGTVAVPAGAAFRARWGQLSGHVAGATAARNAVQAYPPSQQNV